MEAWEQALQKFLKDWKTKKEVIGVLVCGSYVTGKPSKQSDIDTHIILSPGTAWRERGNKIVDGFLIEYFANPPVQIRQYFKLDYESNYNDAATQIATGRILFDTQQIVKTLKQEANEWLLKPFQALDKIQIEMDKYSLWDKVDNLQDAFQRNSPDFNYIYYYELRKVYEIYAKFKKQPISHHTKTYALLTDESIQKKYLQKEFIDKAFVRLFINAINEKNDASKLFQFEKLASYAIMQMGGLRIDGWKLKSPVDHAQ